jgi:acyl-CoA dehydrogenase
VRVPARYLVGEEGKGFKYIMSNFNHERFVLAAMSNRYARVCLEESIKYGRHRQTFGARLVDHQVLRHKVAEMARHIESCHALLEQIAYQMKAGVADHHMAGMIAMTKVHATKTFDLCAREATQIMGGAACVRVSHPAHPHATQRRGWLESCIGWVVGWRSWCVQDGPGAVVERLYREVRINAIGGGSEEILLDLVCRQAKL